MFLYKLYTFTLVSAGCQLCYFFLFFFYFFFNYLFFFAKKVNFLFYFFHSNFFLLLLKMFIYFQEFCLQRTPSVISKFSSKQWRTPAVDIGGYLAADRRRTPAYRRRTPAYRRRTPADRRRTPFFQKKCPGKIQTVGKKMKKKNDKKKIFEK